MPYVDGPDDDQEAGVMPEEPSVEAMAEAEEEKEAGATSPEETGDGSSA